ncbi:MAG: glycosyltransferase [Planctomycetota bacterium]|jgi:glycosyltransferase involved in cell wall biosynthesis
MKGVLFIQYAHPGVYPPVLHASRILQAAGWSVSMLGVQMPDQDRFAIQDDSARDVELLRAPSTRFLLRFFFLQFCWRVRRAVRRSAPDWIYVSDPMACVAAEWGLRAHSGCRVVYHEHDLPDWGTSNERLSSKERLVKNARRSLSCRAERCVVPNVDRAAALQRETGRQAECDIVWNCPSRAEFDRITASASYRSRSDEPLQVVYCGSLNEVRVPFSYIDALVLEPRARLTLIGYETIGSRGFCDRFRTYALDRHVADRLTFRESIARRDVFSALQQSHLAIATVPLRSRDGNMSGMLGASNKSFDGLCVGIPVLVSDLPDWQSEFIDRGVAVKCNPGDPSSIAAAWRWVADHPHESRTMGQRGRDLIADEWNYESQFRGVLDAMMSGAQARSGDR